MYYATDSNSIFRWEEAAGEWHSLDFDSSDQSMAGTSQYGSPGMEKPPDDAVGGSELTNRDGATDGTCPEDRELRKREITDSLDGDIDVFVIAGQSNALGDPDDRNATWPSVEPGVGQYYYPPDSSSLVEMSSGTSKKVMEAAWPSFVTTLHAATRREICIIQTAKGATGLTETGDTGNGNWSPSGTLFERSIRWTTEALGELKKAGYSPNLRMVHWCQGGNDAKRGVEPNRYLSSLQGLFGRYRESLRYPNLPFVVYGSQISTAERCGISNAQAVACALDENAYYVDNPRYYPLRDMMYDDAHWNQTAHNEMGVAGARSSSNILDRRST
ncbi:sialate O-acetylesterase [Halomarina rubra]|uniref:Sialate O-acetylesterase n=1 Tax=Halomarina rubra TaxID=2071873 RepID=A0ABD6ARU4_9EURY|nr:sialate O-acetylesterase [Halomarina rubra]